MKQRKCPGHSREGAPVYFTTYPRRSHMIGFPQPFAPDPTTRAGRMLLAGRVSVTATHTSGSHITVLLKCIADNRNGQYQQGGKKWVACPLNDATHVFCEVPSAGGEWNDKIGTFYPQTGKWFDADNADPERVFITKGIAQWLVSPIAWDNWNDFTFQEEAQCGVCGLALTDPESIARGIGPTCFGKMTGSSHQKKNSNLALVQPLDNFEEAQSGLLEIGDDPSIPELRDVLDAMDDVQLGTLIDEAVRILALRSKRTPVDLLGR